MKDERVEKVLKEHDVIIFEGSWQKSKKSLSNEDLVSLLLNKSKNSGITVNDILTTIAALEEEHRSMLKKGLDLCEYIMKYIALFVSPNGDQLHFIRKTLSNKSVIGPFQRQVKSLKDMNSIFVLLDSLHSSVSSAMTEVHELATKCHYKCERDEVLTLQWFAWTPADFKERGNFLEVPPRTITAQQNVWCFQCVNVDIDDCCENADWQTFEGIESWREFLFRINKPETFLAWIYGIIDADNDGRQALWLYGGGFDGKTAVTRAISRSLSSITASMPNHIGVDNAFVWETAMQKRLLVFADTQNINLVQTTVFHQATGSDSVVVNMKHCKAFTLETPAFKALVTSNKRPALSNPFDQNECRHELTRLIIIDVKTNSNTSGDNNWEENLIKEWPELLKICKHYYTKIMKKGSTQFPDDQKGWNDNRLYTACSIFASKCQFVTQEQASDLIRKVFLREGNFDHFYKLDAEKGCYVSKIFRSTTPMHGDKDVEQTTFNASF